MQEGTRKVFYKRIPSTTLVGQSLKANPDLQLFHGRKMPIPVVPLPHSLCSVPAAFVSQKQEERAGGDVIPAQGVRELCSSL